MNFFQKWATILRAQFRFPHTSSKGTVHEDLIEVYQRRLRVIEYARTYLQWHAEEDAKPSEIAAAIMERFDRREVLTCHGQPNGGHNDVHYCVIRCETLEEVKQHLNELEEETLKGMQESLSLRY